MGDSRTNLLTGLVTWPARMAYEVVQLPSSLAAMRTVTQDLAATSRIVRETIGQVASIIEPLSSAVDRVANIDKAVGDLHAVFFSVLERVPGGKRALRGTPVDRADQGTAGSTSCTS